LKLPKLTGVVPARQADEVEAWRTRPAGDEGSTSGEEVVGGGAEGAVVSEVEAWRIRPAGDEGSTSGEEVVGGGAEWALVSEVEAWRIRPAGDEGSTSGEEVVGGGAEGAGASGSGSDLSSGCECASCTGPVSK
jgi:hypothetical protein